MNGCEDPRIDGGRGRKRAACEWDPGVVLTLLISRFSFLLLLLGLLACGQPLLALSTNPQACARGESRPAQLAWREVSQISTEVGPMLFAGKEKRGMGEPVLRLLGIPSLRRPPGRKEIYSGRSAEYCQNC